MSQDYVVDVRDPEKYAADHIPGAINIPTEELLQGNVPLPKNGAIILHCSSGNKAAAAAEELRQAGYTDVTSTAIENLRNRRE